MIEWKKIFNAVLVTTISTLIVTILVSAAAIVWKEATSVDDKVEKATETLQEQSDYMKKAVNLLQDEIIEIKKQNNELIQAINEVAKKDKTKLQPKKIPEPDYIQQRLPKMGL